MFFFKNKKKPIEEVVERPREVDLENLKEHIRELSAFLPQSSDILNQVIERLDEVGYSSEFDRIFRSFMVRTIQNMPYLSSQNLFDDTISNVKRVESIQRRTVFDEQSGSYKIYPEDMPEVAAGIQEGYQKFVNEFVDSMFFSNTSVMQFLEEYHERMVKTKEGKLDKLIDSPVMEYCGNIPFMETRMSYMIECIHTILKEPTVSDDMKVTFQEHLPVLEKLVQFVQEVKGSHLSGYQKYERIEDCYKQALQIENFLSQSMVKIWEDYLTDFSKFDGTHFHFLAHALTQGLVPVEKMDKMCTTLISEECMPVPYSKCGYIVDFNIDQINTMCVEDAGSWVITKREFIDREMPDTWQCYERAGSRRGIRDYGERVYGMEDGYVWFEEPNVSKLLLPSTILERTKERNMKFYGSTLGEKCTLYNEIFFSKTDIPLKAKAMFALDGEGLKQVVEFMKKEGINMPIVEMDKVHGKVVIHSGLEDIDIEEKRRI